MIEFLYHFSEEADIKQFIPRKSSSFPQLPPKVWAIDKTHAPLYYFPRDCPRIAIWKGKDTTDQDMERFHLNAKMVITIESRWLPKLEETVIFQYTFAEESFQCFDENAGYFTSEKSVKPIEVVKIGHLREHLIDSSVELRWIRSLKNLRDDVLNSSLSYSMIRMRNAYLV
ncbi:DUF6886 family protein [Pseudalkalibacillus decolorationis]|uniref:DUF6886 family protein n=1 Tax=Pseudalkalibacillus decolorationis TaxID=163879 RepID=UPI0021480890|nr:DUF6886 family protein [Pseudalkalibacillus decolorationis]